jgi:hypothetical protein
MDNVLLFLDDVEMTAEEIVRCGFPNPRNEADRLSQGQWIWAVSVWRQLSRHGSDRKKVEELDLSEKGLTLVEVEDDMFPMLKKLSLANNRLNSSALRQLKKMPALEELNISSNGIHDVGRQSFCCCCCCCLCLSLHFCFRIPIFTSQMLFYSQAVFTDLFLCVFDCFVFFVFFVFCHFAVAPSFRVG